MTTPVASSASISQERRRVDELIGDIPGRASDLAFDEPWELRAFALAVAAHEAGGYAWVEFQQALVASIKTWEDSGQDASAWSYFQHWVQALETVLGRDGTVDRADVDLRMCELLAAPANRNHHEPHYEPIAVDPSSATPISEAP